MGIFALIRKKIYLQRKENKEKCIQQRCDNNRRCLIVTRKLSELEEKLKHSKKSLIYESYSQNHLAAQTATLLRLDVIAAKCHVAS